MNGQQLARTLGWVSIGLGVTELVAPRWLARQIGVAESHNGLLQMLGVREIASGVGILSQRQPAGFMWSRVAGDAMDLALLGAAMAPANGSKRRLVAATAAVVGVTALDVLASQQLTGSSNGSARRRAMQVQQSITIDRTPEELYAFWRDFENLPRFMKHVQSVRRTDSASMQTDDASNRYSPDGNPLWHWVVKAPGGTVEWKAEVTEDRPNRLIAWRSIDGADVPNRGSVRFERAPADRGTIVDVEIAYQPPGGRLGSMAAKLFGEEPQWQVKDDLRRLKQIMEAGEVITTEGQPAGRASSTSRKYDSAVRA